MSTDAPTPQTSTPPRGEAALLPISLGALGPLCSGLLTIYVLLIPLHLAGLEGPARVIMPTVDALLAIVFLAQRLLILRGRLAASHVRLLAAGNITLPYLSVLLFFRFEPDLLSTGFVAVILIGCGAFLIPVRWLAAAVVLISTTWFAAVSVTLPATDKLQLIAVLLAAAGLTAAVFVSRRRNLESLRSALAQADQELARREATERTLRDSESRLELAIQGSRGGWWDIEIDPESNGVVPDQVFLSPALKKLIGFAAEEFPDSLAAWRERILEEDRLRVERSAQRHLDGSLPVHWVDYRIRHREGKILWMETLGRVERDAEGRPIRFSGVDRDITERVEQQHFLGLLSRAVEQSSSIVLITDPEGNIRYVNPKFTEVTGYESQEVYGRNPRLLKSNETPAAVYADLWATLTNGGEWHGELKNKTKSGEPFWVLASISPITDDAGQLINFLGVQEDITARKLAEDRMVKSQRLEAVGQLVSGVAHDFNNLLTSILGFSELAMASLTPESSTIRGQLEQVIGAGESAATLARQLLAVGRRQLMRPRILDLNKELAETEELLRRTLGEDIDIAMSLDPDIGSVRIDPAQLQQIVLNLAVNARDAMPQGGQLSFETGNVELDDKYVDSHPGAVQGSFVMLAVSDTGCGMDRGTLNRIFEPFFTTKKHDQGTGLGLATTYGAIKQSGGYIWAYSEPGKGSSFKIYLPRLAATAESVAEPAATTRSGGNETILLVEDAERVRALLAECLSRNGYTVLESSDASQALELAGQHSEEIDLLITDLVLPNNTGLELAEQLRLKQRSLPILLITGYAESALRRKHALDPQIPLLTKPFTMRDFTTTVRQILDREPNTSQSAGGEAS